MTATITPYRSDVPVGRDGFAQLVRAEWTKFRTVRGWVIGTVAAAVVIVLFGAARRRRQPYRDVHQRQVREGRPAASRWGRAVSRCPTPLYFAHQPLTGDGSITPGSPR